MDQKVPLKHMRIFIIAICTLGLTSGSSAQSECDGVRLIASDGATFESFGYSVAVSGDTALVGACCIFASPTYVFSFDPRTGRWI
ncbi:MAG: FG-GAP repeat protein, partial [Planctomycetes bacterium]|nr:FG-GAP repeat protein [Planctomycetota bacterium]